MERNTQRHGAGTTAKTGSNFKASFKTTYSTEEVGGKSACQSLIISLDDQTFAEAEALARKLSLTRSELYRASLREYLARHGGEDVTAVTAALDRVYGANVEQDDDLRREAARRTFGRSS